MTGAKPATELTLAFTRLVPQRDTSEMGANSHHDEAAARASPGAFAPGEVSVYVHVHDVRWVAPWEQVAEAAVVAAMVRHAGHHFGSQGGVGDTPTTAVDRRTSGRHFGTSGTDRGTTGWG